MNLNKLQSYSNWIGEDAQVIMGFVRYYGGWKKVFPKTKDGFPLWASRVRNYFNYYPKRLMLLNIKEGKDRAKMANHYHDYRHPANPIEGIFGSQSKSKKIASEALSAFTYKDLEGEYWYQMSPGSTGYHFEDRDFIEENDDSGHIKAMRSTLHGQAKLPVMKLISPDPSGGSREIIIHSDKIFEERIKNLRYMIGYHSKLGVHGGGYFVIQPKKIVVGSYEGSYNYSETIKNGFTEHDYRDIQPHKHNNDFYVNPSFEELSKSLKNRIFPEYDSLRIPITIEYNIFERYKLMTKRALTNKVRL